MPRSLYIFLILLLIQIGTSEVYAQSSQIEIADLVFPDTVSANTNFVVSGYFQNVGDADFVGSLDLVIETSSGFSGGQASFATSDQSLSNVSLSPGEQIYFTTTLYTTTTSTSSISNIAIVFPRVNNTVFSVSPIFKNLVIYSAVAGN